MIISQRFGQ